MAKRLTDSEKWEDPWFLELSDQHKLLWIYLLDKCDHAGIWKVNKKLAEFCFAHVIDWADFLKQAKDRIQVISSGEKWFIRKFIHFQYGALDEKNTMSKRVLPLLEKEGLSMEDISPINGVNKEREVKVEVKEKEEKKKYGEDGLVLLTHSEHQKLTARLGVKRTGEYISRLNNYIASKGTRYKSHYHTVLNWLGNDGGAEKLGKDSGEMSLVEEATQELERERKYGRKRF